MAEETREQLKEYFMTGDIPTQEQFANLIDSFIHRFQDGLRIYTAPDATKRLGIGQDQPESPLGIQATGDDRAITITGTDGTDWHINLNPTDADKKGFSVDQEMPGGNISYLFLQQGTGKVGLGNVDPTTKLHVTDANTSSATSVKIENAVISTLDPAIVNNRAWQLGHIHDPSFTQRLGAFSIMEETTSVDLNERITILPTRSVGVNEPLPDVTLHVSRDVADAGTKVAMAQGSGIFMSGGIIGPHLVLDYESLQARLGEVPPASTTLTLTPSKLRINPHGGEVEIHSEAVTADTKVIVKNDGKVGVGTVTPLEQLHLTGAVIVGTTDPLEPVTGTIRYNTATSDLEGFVSGAWASLTGNTGVNFWQSAGVDMIRYNTANAKVGIGVQTPNAALHVENDGTILDGNSVAGNIRNSASIEGGGVGTRIGLKVTTEGDWSSSLSSKDVGFFVSSTGMADAHNNISAIISGNMVIGAVGAQIIGDGGNNVLAIQDGAAPAGPPGASDDGIQIYSAAKTGSTTSIFHTMNGDGTVIRLYRHAAMTAANTGTINTGDPATDTIIANMRTRIGELETILKNLGVLPTP